MCFWVFRICVWLITLQTVHFWRFLSWVCRDSREPDNAAVLHRSLGMHERVQSAGTLRPVLEPVSYEAQHESGLGSPSVDVLQDGDASPRRPKGKLPPGSFTQNKRSAERVRKGSTPGIWLYTCWSTDTSQNTGNGRNIHPRVYKLLKTALIKDQTVIKRHFDFVLYSTLISIDSMLDYCSVL